MFRFRSLSRFPTLQAAIMLAVASPALGQSTRYVLIVDGAHIASYRSLQACEAAKERIFSDLERRRQRDLPPPGANRPLQSPPIMPRVWCVLG